MSMAVISFDPERSWSPSCRARHLASFGSRGRSIRHYVSHVRADPLLERRVFRPRPPPVLGSCAGGADMGKLRLAWFTTLSPRTWNDPRQGVDYDWSSTDLYLETARTLERGMFDMLIVADGYGISEAFEGSWEAYVR